MTILLLLVQPFTPRRGKCCPFLGRWCRRYAAHFTAASAAVYITATVNAAILFIRSCKRYAAHFSVVGTAFFTTGRVNNARFSAVAVRVMLPNFTAVGAAFYTTASVIAARCFSAVGVGSMMLIILLSVPPSTQRRG